ncbi:MAG: hypothetical protein IJI27_08075 [Oscillospiraceae bacterium]|nr:hypothetical protein [Oscillospiraceae bacterium]
MANNRLKSIKFPDLPDRYFVPMQAADFSTSTAYAVGDYCIYDGKLYRFTAAHVAGAWNAAHATEAKLGPDLAGLRADLAGLTTAVADLSEAIFAGDSWTTIKALVDHGKAKDVLPIGTQIIEKWEKVSGTEYQAPWDVVHHNQNGDMELNWHYATPDGVPFDAPEAIYYAPSGGLAAGTYHILIGTAYGTGWDTAKAIQFTLTADMDEDDQLVINCGTDNKNDPTNGRAWNVYAKGSTTSKQNGTTSNGTGGTSLGTIGAVNAHRTNGNLNAISRVVYGSGRWKESAIRQWLNSTAAAGAWWTAQNGWDRPPSEAGTLRGFLAGYSADFLNILEEVDVVTALNTQEGFPTDTETTQDKIYLPCLENWYINPEKAGEGSEWDYYKALAQEAGLSGKFQRSSTYAILKKYNIADTSSAVHVRLRSCIRGTAGTTWIVYSSGDVSSNVACTANRGCPACKIRKSA